MRGTEGTSTGLGDVIISSLSIDALLERGLVSSFRFDGADKSTSVLDEVAGEALVNDTGGVSFEKILESGQVAERGSLAGREGSADLEPLLIDDFDHTFGVVNDELSARLLECIIVHECDVVIESLVLGEPEREGKRC